MLGKLGKKVLFFERLVIGEEKQGKKTVSLKQDSNLQSLYYQANLLTTMLTSHQLEC